MTPIKKISGLSFVLGAIVLLGAGCQKTPTPTPETTAANVINNAINQIQASPGDTYSKAVDVDIPDATDKTNADQLKAIVAGVFGDVKTSGYISNFMSNGSLSLEYTIARVAASDDVRKLSDAFKQKNYHIDQTTVYDGNAVVEGSTKTVQVTFSFSIGDQKINVLYSPITSADTTDTSGN